MLKLVLLDGEGKLNAPVASAVAPEAVGALCSYVCAAGMRATAQDGSARRALDEAASLLAVLLQDAAEGTLAAVQAQAKALAQGVVEQRDG